MDLVGLDRFSQNERERGERVVYPRAMTFTRYEIGNRMFDEQRKDRWVEK